MEPTMERMVASEEEATGKIGRWNFGGEWGVLLEMEQAAAPLPRVLLHPRN
jgi:hypothetical protein